MQPVPGYYDSDGAADIAVYQAAQGNWRMRYSSDGKTYVRNWGWAAAEPIGASYRVDDDGAHYGHSYGHDYDEDYFEYYGQYVRTGVHPPKKVVAPTTPTTPSKPTSPKEVPADFKNVEWLHTDVSKWAQTAKLTVQLTKSQIILNYDKANTWPARGSDPAVVANPWIFVPKSDGSGWYAATFEWMKKGQTHKNRSSVAGDHIKKSPLQNFKPVSGTTYGFMVSGLARDKKRNVSERSNVYMLKWP